MNQSHNCARFSRRFLFRLCLAVFSAFFFFSISGSTWAEVKTYTVSVNQFVEHPALDAVLKGIKDHFSGSDLNVEFTVHNAQANMGTATQIARQMMGEKADLMIAIATPSAQACAQALSKSPEDMKRPFLFTAVTDPVAAGLIKDLNVPGGWITGVSDLLPVKAHIDMVMTYKPDIKRLGMLYNAGEVNSKSVVASVREISKSRGFELVEATAGKTADVYAAARSLVGRADAIFIPTDNTIISALESVLKIGATNKLPVFCADVDSVKRGAVAAMGFDYYRHGLQTGVMAEKILKGAKPGEIPVEFQEDLELHINAVWAEKMGALPPNSLIETASQIYR